MLQISLENHLHILRIHWELSKILKAKKVWRKVFWNVKVRIFWKCIQYTIHWDKTQMLKKCSSAKINGTKNALIFLSQAPIYHSFTFNFRFLYALKHKVFYVKLCAGFSIFNPVSFLCHDLLNYTAICHILKAKIKRPVFRKLIVLWIYEFLKKL